MTVPTCGHHGTPLEPPELLPSPTGPSAPYGVCRSCFPELFHHDRVGAAAAVLWQQEFDQAVRTGQIRDPIDTALTWDTLAEVGRGQVIEVYRERAKAILAAAAQA